MMIARAAAAAGLMLGLTMMVTAAMAQPAPAPAQPGAQPAAPAAQPGTPPAAQPGTPGAPGAPTDAAPGTEPPPPAIGPDGLPITPPADATAPAAPAATPPVEEEPKGEKITPLSMFLGATIVVQAIIVLLVLWSVATWTILISKLSFFSGVNGASNRFLNAFRRAGSLAEAGKAAQSYRNNPLGRMMIAAADELGSGKGGHSLTTRVAQRMGIVQAEVGEELSAGMGIFATVGSIAAFVGLFGTVWGIMNSFIGIAETQTTNLAVVAPGIAEALFATAFGLFAAVPAVIFYNMFARRIGAYQTRMDNFASEVLVRVQREHGA